MPTNFSLTPIPFAAFLRRKLCIKKKHISNHQGFQDTLLIDNKIYFHKETLKLLLKIRIILSSNKITLLKIWITQDNKIYFWYFTSSLRKYGKYALLSRSQIAHIFKRNYTLNNKRPNHEVCRNWWSYLIAKVEKIDF